MKRGGWPRVTRKVEVKQGALLNRYGRTYTAGEVLELTLEDARRLQRRGVVRQER